MKSSTLITVAIADDHPIFRKGLRDIIELDPRFRIVGEAADGEEAVRIVRELQPRAILLDIEMPRRTGLEVAEILQAEGLPIAILILTMYRQESIFNRAMDLGVTGYILKESASSDVVEGIIAVTRGEYYISPSLTKYAMRESPAGDRNHETTPALESLTQMERRVLSLIAAARTTRQIADEMHISYRTVESHRHNICAKLGLSGSYALLRFAMFNAGQGT